MFVIIWLLPKQPEPPTALYSFFQVGNWYSTYQEARNEAARLGRNQPLGKFEVRFNG